MRAVSTIAPGVVTELVHDGPGRGVRIPQEAGIAREDQMQGTEMEQLAEIGGRLCYDSLGQGRPSFDVKCEACNGAGSKLADNAVVKMVDCAECSGKSYTKQGYHRHILEVGHLSVWEHGYFTVRIEAPETTRLLIPLLNRPGTWVRLVDRSAVRLTLNVRAAWEWNQWFRRSEHSINGQGRNVLAEYDEVLNLIVWSIMRDLIPGAASVLRGNYKQKGWHYEPVLPETDDEKWISMFLQGSRGWSHEQVRHGDFTAISQRSTRFVDENDTQWVLHPLLCRFASVEESPFPLASATTEAINMARSTYKRLVDAMSKWLQTICPGLDATTRRKQCRGAARGLLGNALMTNMRFSASVAQWKTILRQRGGMAADWEMRELTCCVLECLRASQYADRFDRFEIFAAPDDLGRCVVET